MNIYVLIIAIHASQIIPVAPLTDCSLRKFLPVEGFVADLADWNGKYDINKLKLNKMR